MDYERFIQVLFKPAAPPAPAETERFVRGVMARVEAEAAGSRWLDWLRAPWLVPALSLGMAALFISIVWDLPGVVAPPDVQLLLDAPSANGGQWALPPDP